MPKSKSSAEHYLCGSQNCCLCSALHSSHFCGSLPAWLQRGSSLGFGVCLKWLKNQFLQELTAFIVLLAKRTWQVHSSYINLYYISHSLPLFLPSSAGLWILLKIPRVTWLPAQCCQKIHRPKVCNVGECYFFWSISASWFVLISTQSEEYKLYYCEGQ